MKGIVYDRPLAMADLFGPKLRAHGVEEFFPKNGPIGEERHLIKDNQGLTLYPDDAGSVHYYEKCQVRTTPLQRITEPTEEIAKLIGSEFGVKTYVDDIRPRKAERLRFLRDRKNKKTQMIRFLLKYLDPDRPPNDHIHGLEMPNHLLILLARNLYRDRGRWASVAEDIFISDVRLLEKKITKFFHRHLLLSPGYRVKSEDVLLRYPEWKTELESGDLETWVGERQPYVEEWLTGLPGEDLRAFRKYLHNGAFEDDPHCRFELFREYFAEAFTYDDMGSYYDYRNAVRVRMID